MALLGGGSHDWLLGSVASRPVTDGVRAQVQGIAAADLDGPGNRLVDARNIRPADPLYFGIDVHAYIGEPGARGSDEFHVVVCSPSWFAEYASTGAGWSFLTTPLDASPVLLGTGVWFMRRWDADQFLSMIDEICDGASGGPTWGSVANRIGRWLPWEFDYRYDDDVNSGRTT